MSQKTQISLRFNFHLIYKIGFSLILFLPFLIFDPWFTPIGWGKTIVFRIILSILIFLFLWQIIFRKTDIGSIREKIKSISLPFWLLISLFGIYLLATIFSLDPKFSLWGSPPRSGGFVNFAFYIIFSVLIFLVLSKSYWKKIWDFSIFIGVIASIIAIFQQFGIFSNLFIPFGDRPVSVVGNAIPLALYLLLLIFICLFLYINNIKSGNKIKGIFYLCSFLLFLVVLVFLTQTRAALLGLMAGLIWFFFAYPNKKIKKTKIYAAIILLAVISGMYITKIYLDSHLETYKKIPPIISHSLDRTLSIFEGTKIITSRISAWKVSLEALKDRPILGYGPENFMIGFNKYYDPALPRIGAVNFGEEAQWWDRAHNFFFDISLSAGIPALIIYILLFAALFRELEKRKHYIKENDPSANSNNSNIIASHGIQSAFIAYLITNLFSFDTFETYLISFLLIAFSFVLIFDMKKSAISDKNRWFETISSKIYQFRIILMILIFALTFWFIYVFNIKPLEANKELNVADIYGANKKCAQAIEIIYTSKSLAQETIISDYIREESATIINDCNRQNLDPNLGTALIQKAVNLIKKNIENNPSHSKYWLFVGEGDSLLIELKTKADENFFGSEEMNKLKNEANYYFEKSKELSPKRQELYKEWLKLGILTADYKLAEEKAQECIDLNKDFAECYWLMALVNGYLKNPEKLLYYAKIANEKGYNIESEEAATNLVNMYIGTKNYQALTEVYPKLISKVSDNVKKAQLYASLAVVYKELGDTKKARETALKALEFQPEAKPIVDEFLKTLE